MNAEFFAGTIAAVTIAALAFAVGWWHWRKRTPESLRQAIFLAGVGLGAPSGPTAAAAVAMITHDPSYGDLAGPLAAAGILVGGLAGEWTGRRAARRAGRPVQEELDYVDPRPDDRPTS